MNRPWRSFGMLRISMRPASNSSESIRESTSSTAAPSARMDDSSSAISASIAATVRIGRTVPLPMNLASIDDLEPCECPVRMLAVGDVPHEIGLPEPESAARLDLERATVGEGNAVDPARFGVLSGRHSRNATPMLKECQYLALGM